jgi:hypothetical protein
MRLALAPNQPYRITHFLYLRTDKEDLKHSCLKSLSSTLN